MKHVLFATTALIATASVAAAEVKFSGYGRFGIGYQEDRSTDSNVSDTILVSRFRLNIDGDVETDTGVRFSARVRLQADEDSDTGEANSAGLNGARFSVIFGGLRVDAGNVSGAFDNSDLYFGNEPGLEEFLGQYSGVDYDFLEYSSTGAGSNAVFFQYAVGDLAFGASYDTDAINGADRWDVSATYIFDNYSATVIYGQTEAVAGGDKQDLIVLALGAELGDFSGTLFVGRDGDTPVNDFGEETDGTVYGASLAYSLGAATTITAAYGDGSAEGDTQQYGVGAIYDLGNGATLRGAVGREKVGRAGEAQTIADFGVQFNF
ncbi:porin [Ruegeria sp. SCPT10]|uniref:porin n=1 Tax=Ruegeria sp. SCP10 TaxID=3141377 RepID=UPI00333969C0